jgi:hypothetical protein
MHGGGGLSTLSGALSFRSPLPYRSATRRTLTWATRSRNSSLICSRVLCVVSVVFRLNERPINATASAPVRQTLSSPQAINPQADAGTLLSPSGPARSHVATARSTHLITAIHNKKHCPGAQAHHRCTLHSSLDFLTASATECAAPAAGGVELPRGRASSG